MNETPDVLERLEDLLVQATRERSHFYVASVAREAIASIATFREQLEEMEAKVREAQGVAVREWERNKQFRKQREDARYAAALADDRADKHSDD